MRVKYGILLGCFALLVACGKPSNNTGGIVPIEQTIECDETKLAARDLSGVCRATPQATMGALEAVGG